MADGAAHATITLAQSNQPLTRTRAGKFDVKAFANPRPQSSAKP
jgi:hypothetical protein